MIVPASLRTRLLVLMLAGTAALALPTLAIVVSLAQGLVDQLASRTAVGEVLRQQARVAALVDREVALAVKLADDPAVRAWAARPGDAPARAAALASLESYRRSFRSGGCFLALERDRTYYSLDAADGRARLRTAPLAEGAPADRWYFDAVRRPESHLLNVDANVAMGTVKVWVNVPLRGEGGAPLGVGGGGIDLSDFLAELARDAGPGAGSILVDRRGVLQAHWDRRLVERNARAGSDAEKITLQSLVPPAEAAALEAAVAALAEGRSRVETLRLTLEGRRRIVAATAMPGTGWIGLVALDPARAGSLAEFAPLLVAVAAGIAALVAALLALLDRWLLRPLAALTAAARAVASGAPAGRLPSGRADEIGLLARTFEAMDGAVREAHDRLQARVEERTRQLSGANRALEASQARISESLAAARALQETVLPPPGELAADLGEHVVVYRPRDEVGGDLYEHRRLAGGSITAVLDCTGHGVPGAFMAMSASSVLKRVLDEVDDGDPARVLAALDRRLREARRHAGGHGGLDAGVDAALCRLRPAERALDFAGAGLSLFLVEAGVAREVRGDRGRAGYHGRRGAGAWRAVTLRPAAGARVYLCTDGVLDHPGGPGGHGLGTARLLALLASLAEVPMAAQRGRLEAALDEWAGGRPARDDLTILGFQVDWRS